jgi:hypothetical protein
MPMLGKPDVSPMVIYEKRRWMIIIEYKYDRNVPHRHNRRS